jgi:gluconolactonase
MKTRSILAVGFACASLLVQAGEFEIKNAAEFKKIVPENAAIRKIAGGFQFIEGPVWVPRDGGFLVFSDIPANALKKWSVAKDIETYRTPSANANGNLLDLEGRLLSCEHSGRRVALEDAPGHLITLADRFEGKRLNSPNDLAVKSDGSIWFTDPPYGIKAEEKEQAGNNVYRFDPKSKSIAAVIKDCDMPNGLAFSPDEKRLYVADSGKPRHIRVFDVESNGTVSKGRIFCVIENGAPDGIRCDVEGRVFSSAGNGVHIFAADGSLIGKIITPNRPGADKPEVAANLCFGGSDGRTLFITANTSLYAVDLLTTGAVAKKP